MTHDDYNSLISVKRHECGPLAVLQPSCKALTAAAPTKGTDDDTSGDMVGVLVYLIDGSSQPLDKQATCPGGPCHPVLSVRFPALRLKEFVRAGGNDSQRDVFPNGKQSRCEALAGLCILPSDWQG